MSKPTTYFFEDKPLFGLDIGHGVMRVMELDASHAQPRMVGYGSTTFDTSAIENGIIVKPEIIAKAAQDLFKHHLVGDITTNRVAVSLPAARAFTRSMQVPKLTEVELAEAVHTEAEEYIPANIDALYLDHSKAKVAGNVTEIFLVGMPKTIVDSYMVLTRLLGLEAVLFETSIGGSAQIFSRDAQSNVPSLIIDFGAESADVTVYNGGLMVSGTVACGGDTITDLISKALEVSRHEAEVIKSKYGLSYSKKQSQIEAAVTPLLSLLIKEIRRTVRYYEERSGSKSHISQVVITGGGANMPGLADYLTSNLRLAVRAFDPMSHINFGRLQPFSSSERTSYVTVAGLSLVNPREIFA